MICQLRSSPELNVTKPNRSNNPPVPVTPVFCVTPVTIISGAILTKDKNTRMQPLQYVAKLRLLKYTCL